jgi:hypothetical protein
MANELGNALPGREAKIWRPNTLETAMILKFEPAEAHNRQGK